jgi:hypothetical protein
MPDMHGLAIPVEELLVRAKEHALRRYQRLPHIGEIAVFLRDFIQQRNVSLGAFGIWRKVTEPAVASYPDPARVVHCQRTDIAHTNFDLAPGNAVVLHHLATRKAHIHHAAAILHDGPDLRGCAEFLVGMRLENRHADFRGVWRGSRSSLRRGRRRAGQCDEHKRSDSPKSDKTLGQLNFPRGTDGDRSDSNVWPHSSRGGFNYCSGWRPRAASVKSSKILLNSEIDRSSVLKPRVPAAKIIDEEPSYWD